jgi:hypothetical protein
VHERAGDEQAPAHAARQLVHLGVAAITEVGDRQGTVDRRAAFRARHAVQVGEHGQVLLHREHRVEVVLLRHDAHLRPRGLRLARQRKAEHLQLAAVGDRLRGEHLHGRALAGAVRAEQADAGAFGNVEVEAVDRLDRAVRFCDVSKADCVHGLQKLGRRVVRPPGDIGLRT